MADTTQQLRDGRGNAGADGREEHPDGGADDGDQWANDHEEIADVYGDEAEHGEAESPLGGNADGPARRMGYAELCVSCDNRTDELRLLGNGVVPAVAEKAWRVLFAELEYAEREVK